MQWIHFASLVCRVGFFPVDNIVTYVCVLCKLHRGQNMFHTLCIYLFISLHQWVCMSTHACPRVHVCLCMIFASENDKDWLVSQALHHKLSLGTIAKM